MPCSDVRDGVNYSTIEYLLCAVDLHIWAISNVLPIVACQYHTPLIFDSHFISPYVLIAVSSW